MNILEYLYKAEGTEIHYNSTEEDITSPGGIYRLEHPNAEIFEYIDYVAGELDIQKPSSEFSDDEIAMINSKLDRPTVDRLVLQFYNEFNKGAHLDMFTENIQLAMFSLYTNSPLNAWKSVQSAINKFVSNGIISYKLQNVDGYPGSVTFDGLEAVKDVADGTVLELLFESYMLLEMSKIYAKLAVSNPSKYIKYLNGWNNRLEVLAKT